MRKNYNKGFLHQFMALFLTIALCITMLPGTLADTFWASEANGMSEETEPTAVPTSDITGPVIESVTLIDSGEIANGGSFKIKFVAYDADGSEFDSSKSYLILNRETSSDIKKTPSSITKVEGTEKEYEAEFSLDSNMDGMWNVDKFVLAESAGNTATYDISDMTIQIAEKVVEDEKEEEEGTVQNPVVTEVQFSENKVELNDTTSKKSMDITIKATGVETSSEEWNSYELIFSYTNKYNNLSTRKISVSGVGGEITTGKATIDYDWYPTTYTLTGVRYNGVEAKFPSNVSFEVVHNNTDKTGPAISSVGLYKNGVLMQPGETVSRTDSVQVRAKWEDASEITSSSVTISTDIKNTTATGFAPQMTYNADLDCHVYDIKVSELYATEWYIVSLSAKDIYGNYNNEDYKSTETENSKYSMVEDLYFFIQEADGTCSIPTVDVKVQFTGLGEQNDLYNITTTRRTSLKEMFPDGLPVNPEKEGYTFLGWKVAIWGSQGDKIVTVSEADHFTVRKTTVYVSPIYDKVDVNVTLRYIGADGKGVWEELYVTVDRNSTYRQLMDAIDYSKYIHTSTVPFVQWIPSKEFEDKLDEPIQDDDTMFNLYAEYEKVPVSVCASYINEAGERAETNKIVFVEEGTTYQKVYEEYVASIKHHADMGFTKWVVSASTGEWSDDSTNLDKAVIKQNATLNATAKYTNSRVSVLIRYKDADAQYLSKEIVVIVPAGTTVGEAFERAVKDFKLPEGPVFKKWTIGFGRIDLNQVINSSDYSMYAEAEYEGDDSASTTPGTTPPASGTETPPSAEKEDANTVVKLDTAVVEQMVKEVGDVKEGGSYVVKMTKEDGSVATETPVALLEAIRGKDIDIVLDMGGYSWTINGKEVFATDLKAINLEVKLDTKAIPPTVVNTLAGGDKTRQLSLTHNGDFGFRASLTVNVGSEYAGQFGNLYYHNSNGKLVFMNAGQISESGAVSLSFSHASDYVIVIGRDRTKEETPASPNTGDVTSSRGMLSKIDNEWILFTGMAVIVLVILFTKKKKLTKM